MVYVKKYNGLETIHMPAEISLSTQEENVFRLAELTCEHVGRVCRCIYIQHVHAQIWPCWAGTFGGHRGRERVVHDVFLPYEHVQTAGKSGPNQIVWGVK